MRLEQNGENGTGSGYVIIGANVKGQISDSVASKHPNFGIAAEAGAKLSIG